MTLEIIIQTPDGKSRQVDLKGESLRLGRGAGNNIVIPSEVVSRKHACIEKRPDGWWYKDEGSKNGTYHNGRKIREIKLQDGMKLQLGQREREIVILKFYLAEEQSYQQPPANLETVIDKREPTTGYINLKAATPPKAGRQILGRDEEADIQLQAPVVSRRHASIQPETPEWTITDLGSKNGTFLNGKRITRTKQLKKGDVIQIGPFRLNYEGQGRLNQYAAALGLRVDGQKLRKVIQEKVNREEIFGSQFLGKIFGGIFKETRSKYLLNDVNISCYPKEFIAFVGGSGAGKSTLIKALSGLLPSEGKVLVEGENLYRNYDAYRAMIGYVPQDDILHTGLKVQESLEYSARLRLPLDTSELEIQNRVNQALEQVELTAQRDQVISSLSGGQRKRASIAVELLADPPLFFLDEPTSGLDPGLEKKVMVILRTLAEKGKTIVLVTHATANITECHKVAFMSHGRLVYYGPPRDACEFFDVEKGDDFAEIYNCISDPDPKKAEVNAESWENRFRSSPFFHQILERFKSMTSAGRATGGDHAREQFSLTASIYQLILLTKRYFLLIFRDRTLLTILVAVMPLLAFLILGIADSSWLTGDSPAAISEQLASEMASGESSASYFVVGNAQKLLFIMALTAVMLGLFSSAYEIVKERTIYLRERMVFMQLIPYLVSKVIPLSVFAAVQCFLFLFVIGSSVTFPSRGVFLTTAFEMYLTLFLAVLTAISLGLFISSIAPNQNTVTYIIFGTLFLQITFAGVIFELPGTARNLSSITLTRWTMQALGSSANLEGLDTLSLTRFQPDPITQVVSVEVEKPDPNWEPVTVVIEMKEIPGCRSPVPIPSIKENELVTVTEMMTQTVTIDNPDPVEIRTPYGFTLDYELSASNLFGNWRMLLLLSTLFFAATLIVLRKQDIT